MNNKKPKVMKKILITTFIISTSLSLFSCDNADELTPKIDNSKESFLIPTGSILTSKERDEVQAKWDEYNSAINQ